VVQPSNNFDFALIKDTQFGDRPNGSELVNLQYRAEFFILFNFVTMGLPANILRGSGFGEIRQPETRVRFSSHSS
jgi:hypothetical protein